MPLVPLDDQRCRELIAVGDRHAHNDLIKLAAPHVRAIVLSKSRVRDPELREIVPLMIWNAAKRFDVSRNVKFLTYVEYWLRPVQRQLRHDTRLGPLQLPVHFTDHIQKAAQAGDPAPASTPPSLWRFALEGGLTQVLSVDFESTFDTVPNFQLPSFEAEFIAAQVADVALSALPKFVPPKHTWLFELFHEQTTCTEIANRIGMHTSYALKIARKVRADLKKYLQSQELLSS
jgi:hypothetical protein